MFTTVGYIWLICLCFLFVVILANLEVCSEDKDNSLLYVSYCQKPFDKTKPNVLLVCLWHLDRSQLVPIENIHLKAALINTFFKQWIKWLLVMMIAWNDEAKDNYFRTLL